MLTNNNEIIARIDEQINLIQDQNDKLQKKLQEKGNINKTTLPQKATFRIVNSRYDRYIPTNITFKELFETIDKVMKLGSPFFGTQIDDQLIVIQKDRDVELLIRMHFSRKDPYINICPIPSDFPTISGDTNNSSDPSFIYYLGKPGLFSFVSIPPSTTLSLATEILNPKSTLKFKDSDGDIIAIKTEDEWEYAMNEASISDKVLCLNY